MKTNLHLISTAVAASTALIVTIKIAASYLPVIAISVSYFAVAVLVALVVLDYRVGSKCCAR